VLDGGTTVAGFVVRSSTPGTTSKVLLSVDMLTNQAYNQAGGRSLYDPGRASIVSFDRPGGLPDGRELPLHDWLAATGRPVECCAAHDAIVDSNPRRGARAIGTSRGQSRQEQPERGPPARGTPRAPPTRRSCSSLR
jgi:hypothetical protein